MIRKRNVNAQDVFVKKNVDVEGLLQGELVKKSVSVLKPTTNEVRVHEEIMEVERDLYRKHAHGADADYEAELEEKLRKDLEDKEAAHAKREKGRMTIIEESVPEMYKPAVRPLSNEAKMFGTSAYAKRQGYEDNLDVDLTDKEKRAKLAKFSVKQRKMKTKMLHEMANDQGIHSDQNVLEVEAIRLRSDYQNLHDNIAKAELMLEKFAMSDENKQDLEDKLDHWNNLLYLKFHGPLTADERRIQENDLKMRMNLYHKNKGLQDVFKIFWFLVLPYCVRAEDDGQDYLTKTGYMKFNANMYVALTGCRDKRKCLRHSYLNWITETRDNQRSENQIDNEEKLLLAGDVDAAKAEVAVDNEKNEEEVTAAQKTFTPPPGVRLLPAPLQMNMKEGALLTCISKERFYSSLFEVLDTWAELMNPEYYAVFAWSLLESIGDTTIFPPKLRNPQKVKSVTNINNEMKMLTNFRDASKLRKQLTINDELISRIPEVLARMAARKKAKTISAHDSANIKALYEEMKKKGKVHRGDAHMDTDDSESEKTNLESYKDGLSESSSDDDDDDNGNGNVYKKKSFNHDNFKINRRFIKAGDMQVKMTAAQLARQRTKFVAEKHVMASRIKPIKPRQAKHVEFLSHSKNIDDQSLFVRKKPEFESILEKSPLLKAYKDADGDPMTYWQYASSSIPVEELPPGPPFASSDEEVKFATAVLLEQGKQEEFQSWRERFIGRMAAGKTIGLGHMPSPYNEGPEEHVINSAEALESANQLFNRQFGRDIAISARRALIKKKMSQKEAPVNLARLQNRIGYTNSIFSSDSDSVSTAARMKRAVVLRSMDKQNLATQAGIRLQDADEFQRQQMKLLRQQLSHGRINSPPNVEINHQFDIVQESQQQRLSGSPTLQLGSTTETAAFNDSLKTGAGARAAGMHQRQLSSHNVDGSMSHHMSKSFSVSGAEASLDSGSGSGDISYDSHGNRSLTAKQMVQSRAKALQSRVAFIKKSSIMNQVFATANRSILKCKVHKKDYNPALSMATRKLQQKQKQKQLKVITQRQLSPLQIPEIESSSLQTYDGFNSPIARPVTAPLPMAQGASPPPKQEPSGSGIGIVPPRDMSPSTRTYWQQQQGKDTDNDGGDSKALFPLEDGMNELEDDLQRLLFSDSADAEAQEQQLHMWTQEQMTSHLNAASSGMDLHPSGGTGEVESNVGEGGFLSASLTAVFDPVGLSNFATSSIISNLGKSNGAEYEFTTTEEVDFAAAQAEKAAEPEGGSGGKSVEFLEDLAIEKRREHQLRKEAKHDRRLKRRAERDYRLGLLKYDTIAVRHELMQLYPLMTF